MSYFYYFHNLIQYAGTFLKVMTTNPDCATLDTSILEALHSMQDGKYLHIPVADKSKYRILTTGKSFFDVHI